MFLCCNKKLTPLQRRTSQFMGGALLLTVLVSIATPSAPNPLLDMFPSLSQLAVYRTHPSALFAGCLAALSLFPVLLAVWAAARYLKAEPDEFIRTLVVRALLWGFAVTMAGDAILGVLMTVYSRPFPIGLLNADLFIASSMIAFRLVQRTYR